MSNARGWVHVRGQPSRRSARPVRRRSQHRPGGRRLTRPSPAAERRPARGATPPRRCRRVRPRPSTLSCATAPDQRTSGHRHEQGRRDRRRAATERTSARMPRASALCRRARRGGGRRPSGKAEEDDEGIPRARGRTRRGSRRVGRASDPRATASQKPVAPGRRPCRRARCSSGSASLAQVIGRVHCSLRFGPRLKNADEARPSVPRRRSTDTGARGGLGVNRHHPAARRR
jgi:hypothetical protein